ncbi:hypothetical protein [Gulosibacter sediminis]|uniref:hypothetical protein n=1 Tax=Gulosibacter sediminis TaxID=1729695 RepID=UPI0024A87755|nr:hypothetical protein [Gulosibacter sediminis]
MSETGEVELWGGPRDGEIVPVARREPSVIVPNWGRYEWRNTALGLRRFAFEHYKPEEVES